MDKCTKFFSQLLILGVFICVTTAVSLRHKRNVIAEYNWPEPDPKVDQFPHETTCHYYYLVLSEDDITVNKCPDGELFDYKDHKCASKEKARCWSRHFGKMHHHMKLKSRGHFRCPYAWGKYPDIKDCTRYYVCLSGKVKHKKCAPFEHFDKVLRKCVAEIEGVCADETDIGDPNYKCPRTWGSFSFSEDCSKYYECLEKRPTLRTCPTDYLFHERKEKCLPNNHVHCGSRRNPYRKKEQTTYSIKPENSRVTLSKTTVSATEKKPESKHELISESKFNSTPDPNSIIIERKPLIPNYTPSFKNLSTVNKVTHPEINLVTSSTTTVTPNEINPKHENKVTSESKISTPDPNSIIIQTKSAILDNTQSETNQTNEELPNKEPLAQNEPKDLPLKQSTNKGSTVSPVKQSTNKGSTVSPVKQMTNIGSIVLQVQQMTNKGSTVLPVQQMTNTRSTALPVKQITNKESTDSSVKQSVSRKEAKDLPAKPTVESEESTILPVEQNVTNLKVKDLPAKKIVPNVESNILSSKQSISNESDSSVRISTESILINDTDEVTDNDPEITDEFIEISTSGAKSPSPLATQTIVVDSAQNPKKGTEELEDEQMTAKPPQATPMEECSAKDPTCITGERGQVIRCPGENGLFPYPKDERRFLICEKFDIRVKFCPGAMIFNALERECVARLIFI